MRAKFYLRTFILILAGSAALPVLRLHADEAGEKRYGVVQNIAEDRKVERVGGIYEPEGLDKYMKRRFDAMDSRLDELNAKMDDLGARLDKALKGLEKENKEAAPGS